MEVNERHECDLCHKTYRRRDLLVRHRRHCEPNKHTSKRKACDACVQARSKCSLSQPCTRCAKRSLHCEYATVHQKKQTESTTDTAFSGSDSDSMSNPPPLSHAIEWPTAVMDFSMPAGPYFDYMGATPDPTVSQALSNQSTPTDGSLQHWNASFPHTSAAPLMSPIRTSEPGTTVRQDAHMNLQDLSLNGEFHFGTFEAAKVLGLLRQYPISFDQDDYHTPLLHRELYGVHSLGITMLPKSTAAISCALGLRLETNAPFLKRAISAERQRLVEGFPKYSCLEEWDAIHAMWLYEMMELTEPKITDPDEWRLGPRAKGLNLPILLKMTRRFCQSHPEATDPSAPMSSDSASRYLAPPSAWMTWLVGETARRMVFVAHIVNYFATRDSITGEVSPYYEPLGDDMILTMPLPSSSAAWRARSEQEWLNAMQAESGTMVPLNHMLSLTELMANSLTLKSLFTKFTKDHLRSAFNGTYGLEDSDSLRNLIIQCALEQYA